MATTEPGADVEVWDPLVRVLHWGLALCITVAWLTRHGGGRWHEWIGYASLALIALRLVWGFTGPRYARYRQFVRAPSATVRYALQLCTGREHRYVGHNPLGGWMVLALLALAALAGSSGWLYTTDAWWGDARVEAFHHIVSVALLVLVALHVAGVVVTSFRHRENMVAAMFSGRKRPAAGDDVA